MAAQGPFKVHQKQWMMGQSAGRKQGFSIFSGEVFPKKNTSIEAETIPKMACFRVCQELGIGGLCTYAKKLLDSDGS